MGKQGLVINKDTKKLWRLHTLEKYSVKKVDDTTFEILTKDLKLKAFASTLGVMILANCDNYDKVEVYKLNNYCMLMQRCHFGIFVTNKLHWI